MLLIFFAVSVYSNKIIKFNINNSLFMLIEVYYAIIIHLNCFHSCVIHYYTATIVFSYPKRTKIL